MKTDWTKVVCQKCEVEMKIVEIGVVAVELDSNEEPYNICHGDVAMCSSCGSRVIARWGRPKHRHEDGFQEEYEAIKDLPNTVVFK